MGRPQHGATCLCGVLRMPRKALWDKGLCLLCGGQHCDSTSVSWVGLVTLPSVLFPPILLFIIAFSLIWSSSFFLMVLQSHQAQAAANECIQPIPRDRTWGKFPNACCGCPSCLQKSSANPKHVLKKTERNFKLQVLPLSSKLPYLIVPMHLYMIFLAKNLSWVSFLCLVFKALKDLCLSY